MALRAKKIPDFSIFAHRISADEKLQRLSEHFSICLIAQEIMLNLRHTKSKRTAKVTMAALL